MKRGIQRGQSAPLGADVALATYNRAPYTFCLRHSFEGRWHTGKPACSVFALACDWKGSMATGHYRLETKIIGRRVKGVDKSGELSVGLAAYFDLVGHGWWRGFQGLNLPATSSRRATRNSAMTLRFCAVSQS